MANQPAKVCYKIIESMLNIEVEKEVNELIEQGWKPLGSLLIVVKKAMEGDEHIHYVQAMVKN
jgi:Domain of unknown function (DUF1737)